MQTLNDKTAFISGGGGGIGSALAREFCNAGARVVVADLDFSRACAVADSLGSPDRVLPVRLDVTAPQSWLDARGIVESSLGEVDILCNNAGVVFSGSLDRVDIAGWRWVYEVNVMGSLYGLQTFLPGMKARTREAHILMTCSITALRPFPTQGAYTSSKAALLNMASILALELEGTRVGVSAACPGIVATDIRANAMSARPVNLREASVDASPSPLQSGMSPQVVAKSMVDAILENRFYVFTHADYRVAIAADADAMLKELDRSADPHYVELPLYTRAIARR